MSQRKQLLKGGTLVGAGQMLGMGLLFIRNVILARMLGPENMGVAALLLTTISFIELSGDLSVVKLVVQDREGNRRSFLRTAQTFEFGRGVIMAAVLFGLSWPAVEMFNEPDALWAFQLLALSPLLRSLWNMDYARQQRGLRYLPSQAMDTIPTIITTALAYPLALWLEDWRAVLVVILLTPLIGLITSHLIADRRYRWRPGWRKSYATRFFHFGWPLVINGSLLFWAMQGDRVLMGVFFPIEILGLFYIAANLSNLPVTLLARIGGTLFLAPIAASRDDPNLFKFQSNLTIEAYSFIAMLMTLPFITLHGIVSTIYGAQYIAADTFVGWIAIGAGARLIYTGTTLLSLSRADPYLSLYGSITRSAGVLVALIVLFYGGDFMTVIYIGVAAEISRTLVGFIRLHLKHGLHMSCGLFAIAFALLVPIVMAVIVQQAVLPTNGWRGITSTILIFAGAAGLLLMILPNLRQEIWNVARMLGTRETDRP